MKKIKRMAAVAAVAVAGPTILTATPAMAADQPAVIVPDVAPKDDATADAGAPTTPVVETPGAEKPRAEKPGADKPGADKPVAEKPAPVVDTPAPTTPAPAPAEQPAKDAKAPSDKQHADSDGIMMGPDVSVAGIPKNGFKPGGDWTQLKVTVDNSGGPWVNGLQPHLSIGKAGGKLKSGHYEIESRHVRTDGSSYWWPATALNTDGDDSSMSGYFIGTVGPLDRGASYDIDVRIRFTADAPHVAFDMASDAVSISADGWNWGPSSWYSTKIEGAEDGDEDPFVEGPALTVNGVPETVKAGGDWTNLSVRVDNSGKKALDGFDVGLVLARPDWVPMKGSQIKVEVLSKDKNGKAGWHEAEIRSEEEGVFLGVDLASGPVAAGQSFDIQVRIRLTADAPLGDLRISSWGSSQVGPETPKPWAQSHSKARLTKIVAADPAPGDNGNQPKPNGGSKPSVDNAKGGSGGELAATGADAATTWALGGAGVALAMGAALVAGTGRRRRTTA
ncbi:hypothetical protein OG239_24795 [Streptomyces sp. NBC_00868]|uniref:hypothetical protein n=1 Tax=unclassified Streptomyces TaxID=2593676 RepID=UPI00324951F5|nr:hypothetical protein OG239_24795 [Streptomyces sp. NBC_00868]